MSDCINRAAAIGLKTIAPIAPVINGETVHYEEVVFVRDLEKLPSVDPEREPGKWIDGKCNKCGALAPFWPMATTYYCSEYCPKCGAKMEVDG